MKCPKCQTENPETKKFCRKCGSNLARVCPQCGSECLLEDEFCGECGSNLTTSSPTQSPPVEFSTEEKTKVERLQTEAQGERKHVTVLFSDLCGYTAMSERLDPEEAVSYTHLTLPTTPYV